MATTLYKGKYVGGAMRSLREGFGKIGGGSLLAMMLFPLLYMVLHALKDETLITYVYSHDVTIWEKVFVKPLCFNPNQFYRILFRTPQYLYLFWNTVIIVVPIVMGQLLIGILAAYGFSKLKFWGSETLFFIYIIMMLMPFQVTLVPNYIVMSKIKLLNHYGSLILPGIFGTFGIFFLKQYMEGIHESFIEEARLLGANELQIVTYIITPLCKPVITSAAVLIFIDHWSMVEQPLVFIRDIEKLPLSVYLGNLAESNINIGFACSVLYMILPLLLVLYAQNDLSDSLKLTSLK